MVGRRGREQEETSGAVRVDPNREGSPTVERRHVAVARGGISFVGILTGVVVAFGALTLLSAIVGGAFASSGVSPESLGTTRDVGIGIGVGLVVAWFLACLWGGYTAGRMGRGAGIVNGLLVPIVVLILGVLVGVVVSALGATASLNLPFSDAQFPTDDSTLYQLSTGFGIAVLVAMLLGGALGGGLGARWHTKLERDAIEEEAAKAEEEDRVRRERSTATEETSRQPAAETSRQPAAEPPRDAATAPRDRS
jgi:hypothetical protein